MTDRPFDALLLDLDGTLMTSDESIHPRTRAALDAVRDKGVRLMIVTGRSVLSARPVLQELELPDPAVVFNGAGVWCPKQERLLEERVLSNRTLTRLHEYRRQTGDMAVLMTAERKIALRPQTPAAHAALDGLDGLVFLEEDQLEAEEFVLRVTFMNDTEPDSGEYAQRIVQFVDQPSYVTHFPLSILPRHRASVYQAVDFHAPCQGKAEALRWLQDVEGIDPARVVAVGDAFNDEPMLAKAGLGVAMGNAVEALQNCADRVIGHHDSGAIGELVEELFLRP